MQDKNKPLLLRPSGKDYLWGGSRLNDESRTHSTVTSPLARAVCAASSAQAPIG